MTSPKEALTRMVEVWNAHDREGWMALCSTEVMNHGQIEGVEGWARHYDGLQRAFPDSRIEVTSSAEEGELVAFEVTLTGTHTGTLPPWQATGKRLTLHFALFLTVGNGKITSLSGYGIAEGLIEQLGMAPAVEAVS